MSWYANSLAWIDQQKLNHPDLSHDELKKHCRKNYPYAMRRGAAYKGWLKAMQEGFGKRDTSTNMDMFNQKKEIK